MTARPGHVDIVFDNIGDAQPSRHASNNGARPRKPSSNDYADSPQPNRRKSSDVINFIEYANDTPLSDSSHCDEYDDSPKKPTEMKTTGIKMTIENDYYD